MAKIGLADTNLDTLPPRFEPEDVIIDLDGKFGAFAYACLMRGAGKVITCEPEPGNVELLRKNLARFGDRVEIIPAAVWPADVPAPSLKPPANPYNTCQFSLLRDDELDAQSVPTIPLAEVIARAGGPVRLLKLDCEGADYAILQDVDLSAVETICGEAHDVTVRGRPGAIEDVVRSLPSHPLIDHFKNGPTTWLFYASRAG